MNRHPPTTNEPIVEPRELLVTSGPLYCRYQARKRVFFQPRAGRMDAKQFLGEPRVLVSREALLHNAALVRHVIGSQTKLCAILKAEAYGHGAALVADALCNFASKNVDDPPAVDALAVASIDEAEKLPDVSVPVIIFRPVENGFVGRMRARIEFAIRNDWVLTLCSPSAADDVARIAQACGRRASVQVMIDSGMTRSGVCIERLPRLMQSIAGHSSLRLAGLCTHFACADECDSEFTRQQFARFDACTETAMAQLGRRVMRHTANSGAIFFWPDTHLDMVRPGLTLYGIDPSCRPCAARNFRPAMKWVAPLINIRDVPAGTGVGYGQTWHAPRDSRIGLVPVGYADGYARCFSNRAVMMVQGRAAPVVGRVSMDLTTIDLTDHPHATVGEEVTMLDSDPLSPASVYELARLAETIPYEILCNIGPRIHRVAVEPPDDESPSRRAAQQHDHV